MGKVVAYVLMEEFVATLTLRQYILSVNLPDELRRSVVKHTKPEAPRRVLMTHSSYKTPSSSPLKLGGLSTCLDTMCNV